MRTIVLEIGHSGTNNEPTISDKALREVLNLIRLKNYYLKLFYVILTNFSSRTRISNYKSELHIHCILDSRVAF